MNLPIKTSIKAHIKSKPQLCLLTDWKRIARRAWSVRLSIVAALFTAAEIVVPLLGDLFGDAMPRGLFVLLAFTASIGAAIARLVAQPEMHS